MSQVQRFISLFSPDYIYYIQPYWKKEQWDIIFGMVNRTGFEQSPRAIERKFLKQDGVNFCRCFNLGRSAIQIVLESFHFPSDSEVILPSFSCAGVITPVVFAGLRPVLVDIDDHFNISAASLKLAITENTRAIILPHLSGKLAHDFFEILNIAYEKNLKVIVDATQALGLSADGTSIGAFGDAGIYSFNGGKLIPSSGGGILVTDNEEIIAHAKKRVIPAPESSCGNKRILRYTLKHGLHRVTHPFYSVQDAIQHRLDRQPASDKVRMKIHAYPVEDMDSIEAALALSQLKFVPEIIAARKRNAVHLLDSGVLQKSGFQVPDPENHIFTKFLVTHENPQISFRVRKALLEKGIETEQSYTPLHLRELGKAAHKVDTPVTDRYWKGAFAIPVNPLLKTEDMARIIKVLETNLSNNQSS